MPGGSARRRLGGIAEALRAQEASPHPGALRRASAAAALDGAPMPVPEPEVPGGAVMSAEQKLHLVKHGFVIIQNAVPPEVIQRCRERMFRDDPRVRPVDASTKQVLLPPKGLSTCDEVLDCFNESAVKQMLRHDMGPFSPVIASQVAITPPGSGAFGTVLESKDNVPHPACHVDGTWGGPMRGLPRGMELAPMRGMRPECLRPVDDDLRIELFGEDETETVSPSNAGVLWQDKAKTVSMGAYTCLVGIALNDQTGSGARGQFGVYSGMHEHVQEYFRKQKAQGGPIGPDGPGWPRLTQDTHGNTMMGNGIAPELRRIAQAKKGLYADHEGWPWPDITPCLLDAGDAVIALHACPHSPTPNLCEEARMNLYFRIRRFREGDPTEGSRRRGHGVNDHPDRGAYGQWLDFPEGHDPIRLSVDAMCDHWSEWDGIDPAEVLKSEQ